MTLGTVVHHHLVEGDRTACPWARAERASLVSGP